MSYDASYSGELTLRKGLTENQHYWAINALSYFENVYGDKSDGVTYYEINGGGDNRYHREDYEDLAEFFNGQVDFIGEDDAKWSLFLKDGQVKETYPIEITTRPDEDPIKSIARYINENNVDLDLIVKAVSEMKAHEQGTDSGPSQEQEDELDEPEL